MLQALEAPEAISQIDDLSEAEASITEAISLITDEPENAIEVEIQVLEGPSGD